MGGQEGGGEGTTLDSDLIMIMWTLDTRLHICIYSLNFSPWLRCSEWCVDKHCNH